MFKIIKMTPSIRTLIIFSTVFIWIIGIICMIENMKISEQIRQDDEQIEKLERAYNELLIQTQKREEESLNEEKFYDEMIREYNEEEKQQEKKLYGEYGVAFELDESTLNPVQRLAYEEGWQNYEFNSYVSDMISIERKLIDFRDPDCKLINLTDTILPTTSVIIIFHNEAVSVLLRTIYSVLNRSRTDLLKEIILVDDFSSYSNLGNIFENYINKMDRVSIIRSTERIGLIKARIMGANKATGDVLVFLDSHCEATEGWLEPLLEPIAKNPNVSTVPVIGNIKYNTFELSNALPIDQVLIGGFDWDLTYHWDLIPTDEVSKRTFKTDPIRSPTMPGGLFAISKKYFDYLGQYDSGMEIWGAENLEISFKIWMCGGEILIAPCSHVGHVFRKKFPYKFPSKNQVDTTVKNKLRLAEVWMDDYKRFYYERIGNNTVDYGDITDRLQLRDSLQCKSFQWYLDNVIPEQFIPDKSLYEGFITKHQAEYDYCLTIEGNDIAIRGCDHKHGYFNGQYLYLSEKNEIRFDQKCVYMSSAANGVIKVIIESCTNNEYTKMWEYTEASQIKHNSGWCMSMLADYSDVRMVACDETNDLQIWNWKQRS